MSEVLEVKEQPLIKLNNKYYLTSDSSRNILLQEIYDKKVSRGKNAEFSGEQGYKTIAWFGASLGAVASKLTDEIVIDAFDSVDDGLEVLKALDDMRTYIESVKNEIKECLTEHVALELANIKGVSDEDVTKAVMKGINDKKVVKK